MSCWGKVTPHQLNSSNMILNRRLQNLHLFFKTIQRWLYQSAFDYYSAKKPKKAWDIDILAGHTPLGFSASEQRKHSRTKASHNRHHVWLSVWCLFSEKALHFLPDLKGQVFHFSLSSSENIFSKSFGGEGSSICFLANVKEICFRFSKKNDTETLSLRPLLPSLFLIVRSCTLTLIEIA